MAQNRSKKGKELCFMFCFKWNIKQQLITNLEENTYW